jgi:imidazole glycerol-phosphate synthase subunit HisH
VITIVDYHLNNLRSLENTFRRLGYATRVTSQAEDILTAERLVLPGVGAFPQAMANLRDQGLADPIIESVGRGVPILGVCLGFQLLFTSSDEFGSHEGLGMLSGHVARLPEGVHIPHMGWNQLHLVREDPLVAGIEDSSFVYFVHSYRAIPDEPGIVIASTDYGVDFPSMVGSGNVRATQFHPEKSQHVGEHILRNFAEL